MQRRWSRARFVVCGHPLYPLLVLMKLSLETKKCNQGSILKPTKKMILTQFFFSLLSSSTELWSFEELAALLQAQSQGHHTKYCSPGGELHRQRKCSVIFLKLEGWERAIVNQANVGNVTLQKQCRGTSEKWGGAHKDFSKRIDAMLNWIELVLMLVFWGLLLAFWSLRVNKPKQASWPFEACK